MKPKTVCRFFPERCAAIVLQDGSRVSVPSKGVEVILHTRENETDPCCAEVVSGEHYAEIGLSFKHGELSDFDGVFFLPCEVGEMLTDGGYVIPAACFA